MKRSLEAAYILARRLPPSRIEAIASKLASGASASKVSDTVNSTEAKQSVKKFLDAATAEGLSGEVAAAILMSSSHAHRATTDEQSVELVVTGPSTPFVATRRTEQVLLDLIGQAKRELFLVSFVAKDWKRVIDALVKSDARGITIRVLLEASKGDGGTLDGDQSRLLIEAVPNVELYRWTNRESEHQGGRVHAKIALADDDTVFITSANFTGYAMEKNLEAGVLIKGGGTPQDISRHLKGLIDLDTITRVN